MGDGGSVSKCENVFAFADAGVGHKKNKFMA